jgi:4-hydroxy-tetrahydrodipicolinate reductase
MVRIGILGAGGRMGRALIAASASHEDLSIAALVDRPGTLVGGWLPPGAPPLGDDASAAARLCDVLIDFTAPTALAGNLAAAAEGGCAIVIGTTGLEPSHHAAIDEAAAGLAVLQSANTSLGVNLLAILVEQACSRLGDSWDVEIVELHHRQKADAPSGTALMLGQAAARGRGVDLEASAVRGRDGIIGPRSRGAIGLASLRGGTAAGDHLVLLAGDGERIELGHRAESRDIFANGALAAATWLAKQPAGRYTMRDMLGL